MESYQKLLLTGLTLLLIFIGYEYYMSGNRKNQAMTRIKLTHVQRLLEDVQNASADLNIMGPIEDLKFGEDILVEGESVAKAIILEAICLKDDLIQECLFEAQQCIKDVLSDLK